VLRDPGYEPPSQVLWSLPHRRADVRHAKARSPATADEGRRRNYWNAIVAQAGPRDDVAFVHRRLSDDPRKALGRRIVETPNDFYRFELRDSTVGYVAYVPRGAIARGSDLAATGVHGRVPAVLGILAFLK
jgi:hypothetical protein